MKKNYFIKKMTKIDKYKYIIFSTSYINPLEKKADIESDLSKKLFSGKVLFDLLLVNSLASNRFIELEFDGQKFDLDSSKIVENLDKDIKEKSMDFYRKKNNLLKNSMLPNTQRFLIKKGYVI